MYLGVEGCYNLKTNFLNFLKLSKGRKWFEYVSKKFLSQNIFICFYYEFQRLKDSLSKRYSRNPMTYHLYFR